MSIIPLLAQSAFEPETVEFLVSVFETAWKKVELSGSKLASPAYQRAAQELLAKRIIEMAQRGERDPRISPTMRSVFWSVLTRNRMTRRRSIVEMQETGLEARTLPIGQLLGAFLFGEPAEMGWREQRLLPGVNGDSAAGRLSLPRRQRQLASSDRLTLAIVLTDGDVSAVLVGRCGGHHRNRLSGRRREFGRERKRRPRMTSPARRRAR